MQRHSCWLTIVMFLAASAAESAADPADPSDPAYPHRGFVEIEGNWGVNLGQLPYVPDGPPGHTKHPFANGFGGGATVGVAVARRWLYVIVDYRYAHASPRDGSIFGVLTNIHGSLDFHTLTAGVRLEHRAGPGSLYSQMALGVVFPFHTTLRYTYAPEVAAIGLAGIGTDVENYGVAIGGLGELGYHVALPSHFTIGAGLRIEAFESNNDERLSVLTNFVLNFAAPTPVTFVTNHTTSGPVPPITYSIQDVRLQIALGYRF
jgi:hypothetical protein